MPDEVTVDLEKQPEVFTNGETQNHPRETDGQGARSDSNAQEDGAPYSVFASKQKKMIVFAGSLGAVFSNISTTIYLPALNALAWDLHVSNAKISLTVTIYLVTRPNLDIPELVFPTDFQIFQGLAAMMIAGLSDSAGRRPAYIFCFTIYIGANIGLALQHDYSVLLVLRCLQSAGSSGTIALFYGVTADIVTSAERGVYVGYASIGAIVGPIVGPILGGVISQYAGWRWISWSLTITSGTYLAGFVLFFPETCHKVVGGGSLNPPPVYRCLTGISQKRNRVPKGASAKQATQREVIQNRRLRIPNPLSTLIIASDKSSRLIILCGGLVIACLYALNTGIPSLFQQLYHFNDLQIGLVFVPFGFGSVLSAITTGRHIDWNWKTHCRETRLPRPTKPRPGPHQLPP